MLDAIKKILKGLIALGIGTLVFVWIIGWAGINEVIEIFLKISVMWIIVMVLVSLMIDFVLAWRWQVILKYHGCEIPFRSILAYRMMGYSVSYITPSARIGGEAVRAMMLKRHGVPTAAAFSSVILDKTLELTTYIFFGAIGMLMVVITYNVPKIAYLLLLVAFLLTVYLVFKFFSKLKTGERFFIVIAKKLRLTKFKFMKKLIKGLDEIEKNMSQFMQQSMRGFFFAILMSGILWGLMFVEYFVILKMIGSSANIVEIFLIGVFIGISFLIPVPAALGVLEGGQASLFELFGKGASLGLAFSLIIRGRDLVKTLIGLWLLSHSGISLLGISKKET